MRRFLLCGCAAGWLVVPVLLSGCQHGQLCCTPCNATCNPPAGVMMEAPAVVAPGLTPAEHVVVDAPAEDDSPSAETATSGTVALPPLDSVTTVQHTTAKQRPSATADSVRNRSPSDGQADAAAKGAGETMSSGPDGRGLDRSRFAHDPNYRWLVGPIDYSRIQQAWVLRFVSIEDEDRYGGCVTLVLPAQKMTFKPGQIVRVEGALIDPDSQQLRPAFEVAAIRAP